MSDTFADWYDQLVTVDTLVSIDFGGAQTTERHEDVPVMIEDTQEWSVTASASEAQPVANLYAALDKSEIFTVGSEVTLPDGRVATVRSVSTGRGEGLDGIAIKVV